MFDSHGSATRMKQILCGAFVFVIFWHLRHRHDTAGAWHCAFFISSPIFTGGGCVDIALPDVFSVFPSSFGGISEAESARLCTHTHTHLTFSHSFPFLCQPGRYVMHALYRVLPPCDQIKPSEGMKMFDCRHCHGCVRLQSCPQIECLLVFLYIFHLVFLLMATKDYSSVKC